MVVMRLYLVQHGKAEVKEVHPDRPLSEEGLVELSKVSAFIDDHLSIRIANIFHSGKTRARQTAELLAEHIASSGGVGATGALDPMADPAVWAQKLKDRNDDVMLVGHLPHLSRLAALLVTGDPERQIIDFRNGGIICLKRDGDGQWSLAWAVTPDILK
jgi:phosphohistidine phosphatase